MYKVRNLNSKIRKLENELLKKEQELQNKDEEIKSITHSRELLLKKQKRTVYEVGNVVYIISNKAFTKYYNSNYFKIGKATQKNDEEDSIFMGRLGTYNTGSPENYDVNALFYIKQNELIEKIVKEKFRKQMNPSNKEWIKDVPLEDIINFIKTQCELLDYDYKEIIQNKVQSKKDFTYCIETRSKKRKRLN
jgi:hypothetical protein